MDIKAKVRYRSPETPVDINFINDKVIRVKFSKVQRALTPGQAIVFYSGEKVIGGGWINETQ